MIINPLKIKSEAILLFCRDLINSYKDTPDDLFNVDQQTKQYIDTQIEQLLKAINISCQPIDYYTRNQRVTRIQYIIMSYQFINKSITKKLHNDTPFNPSMLCFALLSTWFAELSIGEEDKEFIYFCLYPYSEVYDTLLLHTSNNEYKNLNLAMLQLAEDTIYKLHRYRFR
jgi:hypothetical protein